MTYASKSPLEERRESFDALWRAIIPKERQEDLPRFIHFRYAVKVSDASVYWLGMHGTLAQERDTYWGNFTTHHDPRDRDSPKTTTSVRIPLSDVHKLMAALRAVRFLQDVPPHRAHPKHRVAVTRRLAVSAPIGCPACLFEMASDCTVQADAVWDCVNYQGWAIDSVRARRNNNVLLAEVGIEDAYEGFIDAMDIRRHLATISVGLLPTVGKSLG